MTTLELARRAAKKAKKLFRYKQRWYLRRKAVKKKLVKGEKEAYKASCAAFEELCVELRNVRDVLRGERMAHEAKTTRAQREALQFAAGFRLGQETQKRMQETI